MLILFAKMAGSERVLITLDGPYTQGLEGAASMSTQHILRTVECKLYPTKAQAATLETWLRRCCWLYNQALEMRIKAYKRRKESVGYNRQTVWLTGLRGRIPALAEVPAQLARSALRRVDCGFKAFFRRCKAGEKPGFPRFRPHQRYNSLECLQSGPYARADGLYVPNLGRVRMRAGGQSFIGKQKVLRVIRRASGWYGQVVIDAGVVPCVKVAIQSAVGVDVGLTAFATLSTGEKIGNPRWARRAERALSHAQRKVSQRVKRSANRRKAVNRLARIHERIAAQRKDFAHQESRKLVNRFDLIGFEKLNIKGLARTRMARSIMDAAWGLFLFFLTYKAENAGKWGVPVDPRGTSQECPFCGRVQKKSLSERIHRCVNGCPVLDRDHAAGMVIRARALGVAGATACGGIDRCEGGNPRASRPDETGSPASMRC